MCKGHTQKKNLNLFKCTGGILPVGGCGWQFLFLPKRNTQKNWCIIPPPQFVYFPNKKKKNESFLTIGSSCEHITFKVAGTPSFPPPPTWENSSRLYLLSKVMRVKSLFANDHFLLFFLKQKGKISDDAIHDTNMLTGCGLGEGRRTKKEGKKGKTAKNTRRVIESA